jgi:hypothetical protein
MSTTESLIRFINAKFKFSDEIVVVEVYLREEAEIYPLTIVVECWPLDLQVSSEAHIFNSLSQGFPAVEHLLLNALYRVCHLKRTTRMRSTPPGGTIFLGRLAA